MTEKRDLVKADSSKTVPSQTKLSKKELDVRRAEVGVQREMLRNQGKVIDIAKEIICGMRDLANHSAVMKRLESEKEKVELEIVKIEKLQENVAKKGEKELKKIKDYKEILHFSVMEYIPSLLKQLNVSEDEKAEITRNMISKIPDIQIKA